MKRYTRRTPEQWEELVSEQQASNLSAPQFCRQNDIACSHPSTDAWFLDNRYWVLEYKPMYEGIIGSAAFNHGRWLSVVRLYRDGGYICA